MNILMLAITSTLLICTSVAAEESDKNLCRISEIEIASCTLEGKHKKILSICASNKKESISYYFGTKNNIELNVNFTSSSKLYRWQDTDTYVTFIGFNRGGYSYVFGVPQETLDAKAFLLVKKSNAPLNLNSPRLCTSNSFGDKNMMSSAIADVDDKVVRNEGLIFPPNSKTEINSKQPTTNQPHLK